MRIAILTSGILPIPAVQGGAVENLVDFYLDYNERHKLHDITIYSVYHPAVRLHPALKSTVNHYHYIDTTSLWARIKRKINHCIKKDIYNNYFIGYFLEQCIKQIQKQNYDIILMENRPSYALFLQGKTKAKFVYHIHNEKLTNKTGNYKQIYFLADRIINVSDYITECVRTINPNDTKCITVHNGIDLEMFSDNVNNNKVFRQELGFDEKDFILVYSGRINKEKGIEELIRSILLLQGYKNIKLLIIGGSFFGNNIVDNDFIKSLKKLSEPIKDRILFTGFIPYHRVPNYLNIADIAVIPSLWNDPFPTTVLEAQAMGLPIISTNRGGIPEEISNDSAILLDANSKDFINNLADSILCLYNNPSKVNNMAKASKKNPLLFSKEIFADKFFASIKDLVPDNKQTD